MASAPWAAPYSSASAGRVMYGGDWPFALLAADDYPQIWNGINGCLGDLSTAERAAVLHDKRGSDLWADHAGDPAQLTVTDVMPKR